jgi:hypothetical protein
MRPVDAQMVFDALRAVSEIELEDFELIDADDELTRLEEIRNGFREEYFSLGKRIEDAVNLSVAQRDYGVELLEQRARLSLLPKGWPEEIICPICHSESPEVQEAVEGLLSDIEDVLAVSPTFKLTGRGCSPTSLS